MVKSVTQYSLACGVEVHFIFILFLFRKTKSPLIGVGLGRMGTLAKILIFRTLSYGINTPTWDC